MRAKFHLPKAKAPLLVASLAVFWISACTTGGEPPPEEYCYSNDDCDDGLICPLTECVNACSNALGSEGANQAAEVVCDDDCQLAGFCTEPGDTSCDDDEDCGPGLVCTDEGGHCEPEPEKCTSNEDCDADEACVIDEGEVVGECQDAGEQETPCLSDDVCSDDEYCHPLIGPPCITADCTYQGLCRPQGDPCTSHGECGYGELCSVDYVHPVAPEEPEDDSDARVAAGYCYDDPSTCLDDAECGQGQSCIFWFSGDRAPCEEGNEACNEFVQLGYCIADGPVGECDSDDDCAFNEECHFSEGGVYASECVQVFEPIECSPYTPAETCPDGFVCEIRDDCGGCGTQEPACDCALLAYCVPDGSGDECYSDEDCGEGFVCDTWDACQGPGCEPNYPNQCIPEYGDLCFEDLDCDEGQYCDYSGIYGGPPEGNNKLIAHGYCQDIPESTCDTDADCLDWEVCQSFFVDSMPWCEEDDESCGAHEYRICVHGEPAECEVDDDCGQGYFCSKPEIICEPNCEGDPDVCCPNIVGFCEALPVPPPADACEVDADCGEGRHCDFQDVCLMYCEVNDPGCCGDVGVCAEDVSGECQVDSDCLEGAECVTFEVDCPAYCAPEEEGCECPDPINLCVEVSE